MPLCSEIVAQEVQLREVVKEHAGDHSGSPLSGLVQNSGSEEITVLIEAEQ